MVMVVIGLQLRKAEVQQLKQSTNEATAPEPRTELEQRKLRDLDKYEDPGCSFGALNPKFRILKMQEDDPHNTTTQQHCTKQLI
mmetsp:Transcript_79180/g.132666  ORF Transcript_79180/g.132666 Transcript_79180/m.132666 type:complete len:84 (+) Transcript_79180:90-341(+)